MLAKQFKTCLLEQYSQFTNNNKIDENDDVELRQKTQIDMIIK